MKHHINWVKFISLILFFIPILSVILSYTLLSKNWMTVSEIGSLISLLILLISFIWLIIRIRKSKFYKILILANSLIIFISSFLESIIPNDLNSTIRQINSLKCTILYVYFILCYLAIIFIIIFIYILNKSNLFMRNFIKYLINIRCNTKKNINPILKYFIMAIPFIIPLTEPLFNINDLSENNHIRIHSLSMMTLIFAVIAALSADNKLSHEPFYLGEKVLSYLSVTHFVNYIRDNKYYKLCFTYVIGFPCSLLILNIHKLSLFYSKYFLYLWQSMFIFIMSIIVITILTDSHAQEIINHLYNFDIKENHLIKIHKKLIKYIKYKYKVTILSDITTKTKNHYLNKLLNSDLANIYNIQSRNSLTYMYTNQEISLIKIIFTNLNDLKEIIINYNSNSLLQLINDINNTFNNSHFKFYHNDLNSILINYLELLMFYNKNNKEAFKHIFLKHYKQYIIFPFIFNNLNTHNDWIHFNDLLYSLKNKFNKNNCLSNSTLFKHCFIILINKECDFMNREYGFKIDRLPYIPKILSTLSKIDPNLYNNYCINHHNRIYQLTPNN